MALSITHTYVSAIADDPVADAAGEITPTRWNAALTTSMATGKVLGRTTAGTGAIEELGTTGTGDVVLATSPTLVTPTLGVASATSINKVTLTAPATGSTLTINDGVTLTVSGSATISGTPPSLAANTFTDTQTIALGSLTADKNALSITATWTNAATYTGAILVNVTDTSSNAASLLMDLKVGGTSKLNVKKNGVLTFNTSGIGAGIACTGETGIIDWASGLRLGVVSTSTVVIGNSGGGSVLVNPANTDGTFIHSIRYDTASDIGSGKNQSGLRITMLGTGCTTASNMVYGDATWNASGVTFTGVKFNVTDTASAAGSLLFDLQVATASKFSVGKAGDIANVGYFQMTEMTAPTAGAANTARIYAVDNGAGKTQLMVIFASGAAQQIAIEP